MLAVATGDLTPFSRRRPDLPAEIVAVLARGLAPDPDDRAATASGLVDELEQVLS